MLQICLCAELARFEFAMSGGFGGICGYFQGRRHVPEFSLPLNSSHVVRLCAELDRVWSLISVASLQARFMLLHSVLWFAAFNSRRFYLSAELATVAGFFEGGAIRCISIE